MLTNRNTCIWRTNTPSPTDGYKFDIKYLQLAVKWLFFAWVYVTCSLKCVFVWMCMYIQTQQAQEGANLKIELMLMDRQQSSKLFSFPFSCQSFLPFFYCSISVLFSLLLIRCFPFLCSPPVSLCEHECVCILLSEVFGFSVMGPVLAAGFVAPGFLFKCHCYWMGRCGLHVRVCPPHISLFLYARPPQCDLK